MYVNCTIGEDPEGNAIIYSIDSVSNNPKHRIYTMAQLDYYMLDYNGMPKVSIEANHIK